MPIPNEKLFKGRVLFVRTEQDAMFGTNFNLVTVWITVNFGTLKDDNL